MKVAMLTVSLLGVSSVSCTQQAPAPKASPAEPAVMADGAGAKSKRVDDLHRVRYIELFLALPKMKAGSPVAAVYNTTWIPTGVPASRDTAPQAWVEGLDFEKMKSEFGVKGASLNGPKLWMLDWCEVENGVERVFNGVKVPWVAEVAVTGHAEAPTYKPFTIDRKSSLGWNKGTTALLLDDTEGNTWIMKGFEVGLKPKYTFEEFVAAGQSQFKQLPPGWKFRVKKLEKDLIEKPEGGVATIMRDEFSNVYDKTGPGMSNYKP
jgi:hypothetical protein